MAQPRRRCAYGSGVALGWLLVVVVLLLLDAQRGCRVEGFLAATATRKQTPPPHQHRPWKKRVTDFQPGPLDRFLKASKDEDDDDTWMDAKLQDESSEDRKRRALLYNVVGACLLAASGVSATYLFQSSVYTPNGFTRISPTQFIAALGDPKATQGRNAKDWGIWAVDPGPRGVWLRDYSNVLVSNQYQAPAGWTFDPNSWWLEEHGLIMESPNFSLPSGRYLVTGGRMTTTGLTVQSDGSWKLDEGATLYDVTHLPCRSAKYTPVDGPSSSSSSPLEANPRDFPVTPGAEMPKVPGYHKQDYAVLFVVGKAK